MKVGDLFEATGDDKFDSMMAKIAGGVQPAKSIDTILDPIKSKAAKDGEFADKIKSIHSELPNALKKQAELEKWVKAEAERIRALAAKMLAPHLHEISDLMALYRKDVNPLDVLTFHMTNKYVQSEDAHLTKIADDFIAAHREDIADVLKVMQVETSKLKDKALAEKWPIGVTNIMRYTELGRLTAEVHHLTADFKEKLGD